MSNQELNEYIRKAKEVGKSNEEIKSSLLSAGWKEEDLSSLYIPKDESVVQKPKKLKLLFYLIVGIIGVLFVAGGILARQWWKIPEKNIVEEKKIVEKVATEKDKITEFILPGSIKDLSILDGSLFSKILTLDGDIAVYADDKRIFFGDTTGVFVDDKGISTTVHGGLGAYGDNNFLFLPVNPGKAFILQKFKNASGQFQIYLNNEAAGVGTNFSKWYLDNKNLWFETKDSGGSVIYKKGQEMFNGLVYDWRVDKDNLFIVQSLPQNVFRVLRNGEEIFSVVGETQLIGIYDGNVLMAQIDANDKTKILKNGLEIFWDMRLYHYGKDLSRLLALSQGIFTLNRDLWVGINSSGDILAAGYTADNKTSVFKNNKFLYSLPDKIGINDFKISNEELVASKDIGNGLMRIYRSDKKIFEGKGSGEMGSWSLENEDLIIVNSLGRSTSQSEFTMEAELFVNNKKIYTGEIYRDYIVPPYLYDPLNRKIFIFNLKKDGMHILALPTKPK